MQHEPERRGTPFLSPSLQSRGCVPPPCTPPPCVVAVSIAVAVALVAMAACMPPSPPPPTPRVAEYRFYLPQVSAQHGPLWQGWPRYRMGVVSAYAYRSEVGVHALADLGVFVLDGWSVSLNSARWAARWGLFYAPRLHIVGVPSSVDRDGVTNERFPDLARCEPATSQLTAARAVAGEFPGMMWGLFNEPDNLDPQVGPGCWDATVGGDGYTGYDGDPQMTGPRYAYRQAAGVINYWVTTLRSVDPTARFHCCGELGGATASYVRGVADAYRELYGERLPIAAVSLHIYQVNNWNVASYVNYLRMGIAAVDTHPDLRGLPIVVNEGINLSLNSANASRDAALLHEWFDRLGADPLLAERVKWMAWWVDYIDRAADGKQEVGTRLFDGDPSRVGAPLSVVGKAWQNYACNWLDHEIDITPRVCPRWWWE